MGPLRDDDVGALIQYLARLSQTLHLTDCDNARPMNRRQKWSGIAKRQHDRCRSVADRLIEGLGRCASAQVINPHPTRVFPADANSRSKRSGSP
jgi:hypothetical protein